MHGRPSAGVRQSILTLVKTDQGAQFTAEVFTGLLALAEVEVSRTAAAERWMTSSSKGSGVR
jgi:hypothetical protein